MSNFHYSYSPLNEGYILKNVSLGNFIVRSQSALTNLDGTAHYAPRLYG